MIFSGQKFCIKVLGWTSQIILWWMCNNYSVPSKFLIAFFRWVLSKEIISETSWDVKVAPLLLSYSISVGSNPNITDFILFWTHLNWNNLWMGSNMDTTSSSKEFEVCCIWVWLNTNHSWPSPFQKRAGFNEHQGLRQKIHTNAKDTARLCGQILNFCCCFDLFVYIM